MSFWSKLTTFARDFRAVLALGPALIELMKLAEAAIPGEGRGELRLRWVREQLEAAYRVVAGTVDELVRLWPMIDSFIERTIARWKEDGGGTPAPEADS